MSENTLTGFLLVNKPSGVTSFYCIKKIRECIAGKIKVGHAGTLDSFATGLLIVAIGRAATREIEMLATLDKQYIAEGKLGQQTDTLDFTGKTISEDNVTSITAAQLEKALASFGKHYDQTPPVYSALKYEGERISALARKGKMTEQELQKVVSAKIRTVSLYELKLTDFDLPYFTVKTHVSHGTYVRTLMDDIAQKLDTHATTHALQRTDIGPFGVGDAQDLRSFETEEDVTNRLLSIEQVQEKIKHWTIKES